MTSNNSDEQNPADNRAAELQTELLAAHNCGDFTTLITLYTQTADQAEQEGNINSCCFFLTHAHVFALEHGDMRAESLRQRLKGYGREE